MATSGLYAFDLPIDEIIEEAYERTGIEDRGAYQLKTARRSLDLLLTEWINEGVNLWTVDQLTVALTASTNTYTIDARYSDILDVVIRNSDNVDLEAVRISLSEYLAYPTKDTEGRPVVFTIERNVPTATGGGHTIYVWPTPDVAYTLVTWAVRHIQDAGSYSNTVDVPKRFLPALISGLAYKLAEKAPLSTRWQQGMIPLEKLMQLKAEYDRVFEKAKDEDRERSSLFILPSLR